MNTTATTVEVKGDKLVITLPINKPLVVSKSGKSRLVASSNGNMATTCVIEGKPVIIGVNAYIKN